MESRSRVKFNVGGRIFETTTTTLANAGRDSYLGAMFDSNWNFNPPPTTTPHFIDRNPDCFSILLDLLRTNKLHIPPNIPQNLLYSEASFYGLTPHLRTATWSSPIDGNRLTLSHSIHSHAPGDGTAIRGSPDGGCAVAHGCMVHHYDWALAEHPPLHLDYQNINDIMYLNSNTLIISACEKAGRGDSGMGAFNVTTGELRHKYQIRHTQQPKSYTAGAMSYNPDENTIFASCKGRSNEYGIGVWDELTGKQTDFFHEPIGWSLGEADRLQYLSQRNSLLVSTLFPRKDNCYITLLDFRTKSKIVWSWTDKGSGIPDEKRVRDAVSMDDLICVVNEYEDLGFMDIRTNSVRVSGSVKWSSRSKLASNNQKMVDYYEPCYPKLAVSQGQLFSSMNDCVSVFSGPDWVLTSRMRRSVGGSICDFSIAGDRLFALHSEHNVFDVWQTPPTTTS